eukprot:1798898-Amphidinium_carterae.2
MPQMLERLQSLVADICPPVNHDGKDDGRSVLLVWNRMRRVHLGAWLHPGWPWDTLPESSFSGRCALEWRVCEAGSLF